jgi:hypothetical protein
VERQRRAGHTTDDNIIRRMRIACLRTKATDTYSEYVIFLFHCNNGYTNAPLCYGMHTLSAWAQPRGEHFHLGERNEDSTKEISAREGVVVCLVIGRRTGMSDRRLMSPKWHFCSRKHNASRVGHFVVARSVCVSILCCLTTLAEIIQRR